MSSDEYTYNKKEIKRCLDILRGSYHVRISQLSKEAGEALSWICDCARNFPVSSDDYREVMNIIYKHVNIAEKDIVPFSAGAVLIGCKSSEPCSSKCIGSLIKPGSKLCQPFECMVTKMDVYENKSTGERRVCLHIEAPIDKFKSKLKDFMRTYGDDLVFAVRSIDDSDEEVLFNGDLAELVSNSNPLWWLALLVIIVVVVALIVYVVKKKDLCC